MRAAMQQPLPESAPSHARQDWLLPAGLDNQVQYSPDRLRCQMVDG